MKDKKEDIKINHELWIKGTPEEVSKIIDSLKERGFNYVKDVPIAMNRKVVVLQ